MAIIEKTDIYNGDDPFKAISEGLALLVKAESELLEQNTKLIASYAQIKADNSGDEAKRRAAETKLLAENNKQIIELEKLRAKIEKELQAERVKSLKEEQAAIKLKSDIFNLFGQMLKNQYQRL